MQVSDFDFHLPTELIARFPIAKRSASRLMHLKNGKISHHTFSDILQFLNPGDLVIFNDTKVIPARLRGHKKTGGQVEVLVERILSERHLLAQMRVSKSPHVSDLLYFPEDIKFKVIARKEPFYELELVDCAQPLLKVIEQIGEIPLPPYMQRNADEDDKTRYQTIYAKYDGSVAAPTAGLHFDEELVAKLKVKQIQLGYLTLHIGAGTFKPVRAERIEDHQMHAEYFELSPALCELIRCTKEKGKKIVAVGTTTLRSLETASRTGRVEPFAGETSIFIYPGFNFNCVDALITNLHLPRSTLLMLVSAFGGYTELMAAYQSAVKNNYRFYSYGDAMWIDRK